MFLGVVPPELIEQITQAIDFSAWPETYVCCSGTFRMERGILSKLPEAVIHSNDVSLYTVPIGRYLTGVETPLVFVNELAFVEDVLGSAPYTARIAAVMVASDMAKYAAGSRNRFKDGYTRHYRNNFGSLVKATEERLHKVLDKVKIETFFAGDWIIHAKNAMAAGAGIAAFPPFFKGGYEVMFKWIGDNIDWTPPEYDLYDPTDLPLIVDEIDMAGIPYCILTDQVLEGRQPVVEWSAGRRLPHYCYTSQGKASFYRSFYSGTAFRYKPIEPAKITADSKVKVIPALGEHLAYVKDVYLAKGILHCAGRFNFLVTIDDMLVGGMIYDIAKFPGEVSGLYLLSDVSITREARLSKLIAKLTLSRDVISVCEKKALNKFGLVTTTAFSPHPVSMKYRGIYEKKSCKPSTNPLDAPGTNVIQYEAEPITDSAQDVFDWWWKKHGKAELAKAGNRNSQAEAQGAAPA